MILFRAACVPEFGSYSVKNAEGAGHCLLILQKASPNAHREINSPPHAIPIYSHPAYGVDIGTHERLLTAFSLYV